MARKTLNQRLKTAELIAAHQSISVLRENNRDMTERLRMFEIEVKYLRQTERRFDQLLEGMCADMKEANLPRRIS